MPRVQTPRAGMLYSVGTYKATRSYEDTPDRIRLAAAGRERDRAAYGPRELKQLNNT
jgi:hypothetical protein